MKIDLQKEPLNLFCEFLYAANIQKNRNYPSRIVERFPRGRVTWQTLEIPLRSLRSLAEWGGRTAKDRMGGGAT